MKVQATNPIDIALAAKAGKQPKALDEFRDMLETALTGQTQTSGKKPVTKTGETAERPEPPKDEAKPDEAAQAQAAATAVTPQAEVAEQQPDATVQTAEAKGGQQAQVMLNVVHQQAAPTELELPAQTETQTGAAAQAVVEVVAEPAAEQQTAQIAQPQPQDRFGELLGRAQQELQSIADKQGEAVTGQQTVEQVPEQPVVTGEAEQPGQTVPTGETEQPEQTVPTGETEQPEQPVQTGETEEPEAETAPKPAEPEVKQPVARVREEPEHRTSEQRPLGKMPEEDRAVIKLRENTPQQKREPEPVVAEAVKHPEPTVQPQREVQPEQPQPTRQPMTGTEQMEQVRVQVMENASQGRTEFRMQLQPEELGKVDIRMVLEGGRLAVEIIAASPKAAELLTRQAEGLMQSLRLQNLDVQSVNVVTESSSADKHMDGAFNMMNGQAQQSGHGEAGKPGYGRRHAQNDDEQPDSQEPESPETLMDYAV